MGRAVFSFQACKPRKHSGTGTKRLFPKIHPQHILGQGRSPEWGVTEEQRLLLERVLWWPLVGTHLPLCPVPGWDILVMEDGPPGGLENGRGLRGWEACGDPLWDRNTESPRESRDIPERGDCEPGAVTGSPLHTWKSLSIQHACCCPHLRSAVPQWKASQP